MSVPLRELTGLAEIQARLGVLYDKGSRIVRYNASCAAGRPDVMLLDEKQRAIMRAKGRSAGEFFPARVLKTLGRTIDVLECRRRRLGDREGLAA